jgi:RNA polymerase sigma-70 factor (ECF subfamily)
MLELIEKLRRQPSVNSLGTALLDDENRPWLAGLDTPRTSVVQFLYRMVHQHALAESLAAEVFTRLRRTPEAGFTEIAVFRIAANLALEALRRPGNSRSPDNAAPDIRREVISMPPRQRIAVILHKYHRLDYGQIARVLNCSEAASKSLLISAYASLRRRLASDGAVERWDCTAQ